MSLSATLYTLAAIGFFALMVNRPPVEIPSMTESMPAVSIEASEPTATETTAATNTSSSTETITGSEPPQDRNNSVSQPAGTTPTN